MIYVLIVIIVIAMTMLMVLSSWHCHCESSFSLFDECSTNAGWPSTFGPSQASDSPKLAATILHSP